MLDARHALAVVILPPLAGCGSASAHPACATPADGGPAVLVTGGAGAQAIVVDATNAYWIELGEVLSQGPGAPGGGEVLQCAKCSCDHPTILASNETVNRSGIAVDATSVYWTNGDVMRVPIGGGEAVALAVAQTRGPIAVDTTSVYWADANGLMKVPITGGHAITVVPRDDVTAIAVDAKHVYYAAGNGVFEVGLGGGPPKQLGQASSPQSVAVDSASVYWTDNGGPVPGNATLMKVAIAGGKPVMLASGFVDPFALAVDATSAYWTGNNEVMKVPIAGGSVTTLVRPDATDSLFGVAVDETSVYWTNALGSPVVMKRTPK
jgi:hypothetical protein